MQIDTDKITSTFDGNKTYIVLGLGIVIVLADHILSKLGYSDGLKSVGVNLDDTKWLENIFTLVVGMTARSAVKKAEIAPKM